MDRNLIFDAVLLESSPEYRTLFEKRLMNRQKPFFVALRSPLDYEVGIKGEDVLDLQEIYPIPRPEIVERCRNIPRPE